MLHICMIVHIPCVQLAMHTTLPYCCMKVSCNLKFHGALNITQMDIDGAFLKFRISEFCFTRQQILLFFYPACAARAG